MFSKKINKEVLQTILEDVGVALWMVGRNFEILWCNQLFLQYTKDIFANEVKIGSHALEIIDNEDDKMLWKRYYEQCLLGEALHERDTTLIPIYEEQTITSLLCFSVKHTQTKKSFFSTKINQQSQTPLNDELLLTSLQGLRVLFVEDNMLNQHWTGKLLQNWQIAVDYAITGRQAVEKVLSCPANKFYHAILMDIDLPDMDGYEATKRIRAYTNVPIIAFTASPPQTAKQKAFEVGMNDFIGKPFAPELLHKKLTAQTVYSHFITTKVLQNKQLADFEAMVKFADGDLAYQQDMCLLYQKFFIEFPIQYTEILNNQDLAKLKSFAHKSYPSVKLLQLECLEKALNTQILALENQNDVLLQQKKTIQTVKKFCTLCLVHLKLYTPTTHES